MGGPLAKLRNGDIVRFDGGTGQLEALVDAATWAARPTDILPAELALSNSFGMGRELFAGLRRNALSAEEGACTWL